MKDQKQIETIYLARKRDLATVHAEMMLFDDFVADKLPVPLPELDRNEKSAIANLAGQGLKQISQRVGSVLPMPEWPSVRGGFDEHDKRAAKRKRANLGWWEQNDMQAVLTLRAEYLLAHAMAPVSVLPDPSTGVPTWRVRDPRETFPARSADPLNITPRDTIFAYKAQWGWLRQTYGTRVEDLRRPEKCSDDQTFTMVEYVSDEQITYLAMSDVEPSYSTMGLSKTVVVEHMANRAGCPLVFVPTLFGVGGMRGKFTGTIGVHQMRAKLLALAYITASKGAAPDTWLEPFDGQSIPQIETPPDHREGTPGVISGGKLKVVNVDPSFASGQMMSILERELRQAGGIPAAFGGEAPVTVQTGRLASNLTASAIDFPIQEAQRKFERSLECENKAAVAIVRNWTPGRRSFYVGWKGNSGQVDYDPREDFDTDNNQVRYPLAGSDMNNLLVRTQGKVASGLWSLQTAREQDPETADAEVEHDRVVAELLERALLDSLAQQAAQGAIPPADLARIMLLVRTDKAELAAAIEQVQREAQERQATPVPADDPAAQPGLAQVGAGAEAMATPSGPPDLSGLSSIVSQIRNTARPVQAA